LRGATGLWQPVVSMQNCGFRRHVHRADIKAGFDLSVFYYYRV
jgi:hypothetical protein